MRGVEGLKVIAPPLQPILILLFLYSGQQFTPRVRPVYSSTSPPPVGEGDKGFVSGEGNLKGKKKKKRKFKGGKKEKENSRKIKLLAIPNHKY